MRLQHRRVHRRNEIASQISTVAEPLTCLAVCRNWEAITIWLPTGNGSILTVAEIAPYSPSVRIGASPQSAQPSRLPHTGHSASSVRPYQIPWQRLHQWPPRKSSLNPSWRASALTPSSRAPPGVRGGVARACGKRTGAKSSLTHRPRHRLRDESDSGESCSPDRRATVRVRAPPCCDSSGSDPAYRAPGGPRALRLSP